MSQEAVERGRPGFGTGRNVFARYAPARSQSACAYFLHRRPENLALSIAIGLLTLNHPSGTFSSGHTWAPQHPVQQGRYHLWAVEGTKTRSRSIYLGNRGHLP